MSGHLSLHARLSSLLGAAALAVFLVATGCTSSAPRIKVLGVEQTQRAPRQSLVVFVEVVNPTGRNLTLSRLEYRVRAQSWFETKGEVRLTRQIGAESSAVVEIPVPVERAAASEEKIPFTLEGTLFARENQIERSWDVEVKGALGSVAGAQGGPIRVTVVD